MIAPLVKQPKCELTPNEHSTYIRFLWANPGSEISAGANLKVVWAEFSTLS